MPTPHRTTPLPGAPYTREQVRLDLPLGLPVAITVALAAASGCSGDANNAASSGSGGATAASTGGTAGDTDGSGGTLDLGAAPEPPPTLFVRPDGDDDCDGRADAPGPPGAGSCAFATIRAGAMAAGCGDVVAIRAGRYPEPRIAMERDCPADAPVVLRGDGQDATWWMAGLAPVATNTCAAEGAGPATRCALPPAALDPGPTPATGPCVVQGASGGVRFEDENGVRGDMTGPVCLTWNTAGPAGVAAAAGHVTVEGDALIVRPWNDVPVDQADLWATVGCGASSSYGAVDLTAGAVSIEALTVVSGCGRAVNLAGRDQTLRDVTVYTGTVTITAASERARLLSTRITNAYRRPVDQTATAGAEAWNTNSQALSVWGAEFLLRDVETYAAREGAGFANGAHDGLVDGATFHGHHNHGFKIQDSDTRRITFRDVLAYNAQEGAFIECPQDIVFAHVTLPGGPVVVQGNPAGCTPARLTFVGSVLCGITWFDYGGDTWAQPGGHVLDRNVYVSGAPTCRGRVRHIPSDSTFDLPAWQGWASDTCADCVRDPNSVVDDLAAAFTNFVYQDDTQGAAPDFHPTPAAACIDLGDPADADALDRDGAPRQGAPDAGCYEL